MRCGEKRSCWGPWRVERRVGARQLADLAQAQNNAACNTEVWASQSFRDAAFTQCEEWYQRCSDRRRGKLIRSNRRAGLFCHGTNYCLDRFFPQGRQSCCWFQQGSLDSREHLRGTGSPSGGCTRCRHSYKRSGEWTCPAIVTYSLPTKMKNQETNLLKL